MLQKCCIYFKLWALIKKFILERKLFKYIYKEVVFSRIKPLAWNSLSLKLVLQ